MKRRAFNFILLAAVSVGMLVSATSCNTTIINRVSELCETPVDFKVDGINYRYFPRQNSDGVTLIADSLLSYKDTITIPEKVEYNGTEYPVTVIGEKAFAHCTGLTKVIFNSHIQVIEEEAFTQSGITEITIPEGVQVIGEEAFKDCKGITSLSLNNVQVIGEKAFTGCSGLKEANLSNIQVIGEEAFAHCTALTSVAVYNIQVVGNKAFTGCVNLESKSISNVQVIDNNVFSNCPQLKAN